LKVCPGSASASTTVTISAPTLCGAASLDNLTVVFLGPTSYVGAGGGGDQVPTPYHAKGTGFEVTYPIPSSYYSGEQPGGKSPAPVAVTPGTGYSFATYPAGGCTVRFTVTAP
jgi:hypothetical protein